MSKKIYLIVLLLLTAPFALFSKNINDIIVDFDVVSIKGTYTVNLKLINFSEKKINFIHPDLQSAMTIIIMNESGNIIQPTGIAKVSPRQDSLSLKAGQTYEHTTSVQFIDLAKKNNLNFPFLSDSGLFGYKLVKGNKYRIIVVYRPEGKNHQGICSNEKIIKIEAQ